jgi:3-dehydroquinate synthase
MAEVIKYGMLHDADLFQRLASLPALTPDSGELPAVIRRCCAIKAEIVRADERETAAAGGRALLNLGHTFAHAIEQAAGYGDYLHGEAVAAGLVLAARLSAEQKRIGAAEVDRVRALVEKYRLPAHLRAPLPVDTLMTAMRRDKKVRAGKLRFVVLEALGEAVTCDQVDPETVARLWREAGAE